MADGVILSGYWIEIGFSISLKSDMSQTASLMACVCLLYLALQVERATVGWN